MTQLAVLGAQAKESAYQLSLMDTPKKNQLLLQMAADLEANTKKS